MEKSIAALPRFPATDGSLPSLRPNCLQGYCALVTGGGSGICKEIARQLMACGCHVAILSRSFDRVTAAAQELSSGVPLGVQCLPVAADVRHAQQVERAIDKVLQKFGRIDILVNGAAGNFLAPAGDISYNAFKTVLEIDTCGTFNCSQLVYKKAFRAQEPRNWGPLGITRGIIVNISMTLHHMGTLFQAHAGAAKAAIDALTKHLAVEWGCDYVRVVGLAPGAVDDTEGFARLVVSQGESPQDVARVVPLQRLATSADIARTCVLLCLPEASYVTGVVLVVDGGHRFTVGAGAILQGASRDEWLELHRPALTAAPRIRSKL